MLLGEMPNTFFRWHSEGKILFNSGMGANQMWFSQMRPCRIRYSSPITKGLDSTLLVARMRRSSPVHFLRTHVQCFTKNYPQYPLGRSLMECST